MIVLMRVRKAGDTEMVPIILPRRRLTAEDHLALAALIHRELGTLLDDFEPGVLGDLDADDPDEPPSS